MASLSRGSGSPLPQPAFAEGNSQPFPAIRVCLPLRLRSGAGTACALRPRSQSWDRTAHWSSRPGICGPGGRVGTAAPACAMVHTPAACRSGSAGRHRLQPTGSTGRSWCIRCRPGCYSDEYRSELVAECSSPAYQDLTAHEAATTSRTARPPTLFTARCRHPAAASSDAANAARPRTLRSVISVGCRQIQGWAAPVCKTVLVACTVALSIYYAPNSMTNTKQAETASGRERPLPSSTGGDDSGRSRPAVTTRHGP